MERAVPCCFLLALVRNPGFWHKLLQPEKSHGRSWPVNAAGKLTVQICKL